MLSAQRGPAVRRLLLFALSILLALGVARYHTLAFPQLSPRFSLKKHDVTAAAAALAARLGLHPDGYRRAVTFSERDNDKTFLELEYGPERVAAEAERGVALWSWSTRFFKPGQLEEFSIGLDTEGHLVDLRHTIPEDEVRPRLTRDEARARAEAFLAAYVPRQPVAELKLTETEEEEKPGHTVIGFTWERRGWVWGDGTYHLHASVSGDAVTRYFEHVDVPEAWSRDYRKRRALNQTFQGAAAALAALLVIAALVQSVRLARGQGFRVRRFPKGWAVGAVLVALAAAASMAPQVLASYATEDSLYTHVAQAVLWAVLGAVSYGLGFWLLGVLGDGFLRESLPGSVSLRALLGGRGLATREGLRSVGLAFPLAIVMLAWQTAYYIFGRQIGFWSPAVLDYSQVFTSLVPAVEALNIGLAAGWIEEIAFRAIFLAAIWRLTRSKWLAIGLTALIWGFLHSSYPQFPGYARGVELTVVGLLLGWAATRFGILTTVLAHCLFNTWIGAVIAWKTGSPAQMAMAAAVSGWPAALWVAGRIRVHRRGGFEDTAHQEEPPRPALQPAPVIDTRVVRPTRAMLGWVLLLGVTLALTRTLLPEKPLADLGKVYLTRAEAGRRGDAALHAKTGLDPASYRRTIYRRAFLTSSDEDYLLKHTDAERLADLSRRYLFEDEWTVKYFRDGERETWTAHLAPLGELRYLFHSVAETAPGAQFERDDAIGAAAAFLRVQRGLAADEYRFLDLEMTQQKERRDYTVRFESTRWDVGESKLRWTVSLQGDELEGWWAQIKLPEAYERERSVQSWKDMVRDGWQAAIGLAVAAAGFVLLYFLTTRRLVPWRLCLLLGLVPLALKAAETMNAIPEFFVGYDTAQSVGSYTTRHLLGVLSGLPLAFALGVALLAVLAGTVHWVTRRPVAGVLFGGSRAEAWRRFSAGVLLALVGFTLTGWLELLAEATSLAVSGRGLLEWATPSLAGYSPGAGALLAAVRSALGHAVGKGALVLLAVVLWKRSRLLAAAALAASILPDLLVRWEGPQTLHQIVFENAAWLLELFLCVRLFRFNPYPYLLLPFFNAILPAAAIMTAAAWPALRADVLLLWVAAAAPLVAAAFSLVLGRRGGGAPEERRYEVDAPRPGEEVIVTSPGIAKTSPEEAATDCR